ncbi:MAG TPA: TonB-dependent receptor [Lentimicrobium sp.]|nr:TonB-dependent receptor [Lentimicrobium sp.]
MKKLYIIFIILNLTAISLIGQTITVIDKLTGQPVSNVALYSVNPPASTITNAKGQADIAMFRGLDRIIVKHVSYNELVYTYDALKALSTVELELTNISLNEVVISANRWEQEDREVPHRIEKITQREVQFQNPQTAADLLGAGGYAYIQKSQLAGGSPILRGFATNRVLLVVDGVRMNNAIFRTGNVQNVISLDALAVQSNEILFGPGAVMYGSDAIGGVMDFHTLDPILSESGKNTITGSAITRYSSANNEETGHLDFNIGLAKWAFRTAVTYTDFDDLKAGKHGNADFLRPVFQTTINGVDTVVENKDPRKLVYSGYSQANVMQRIKFVPNNRVAFDYGFYYSETSDAPRYDRLILANSSGALTNAEWYYGPQKWMMNRLTATLTGKSALFDNARIQLAHQLYQESRHDRKFNNARLRNQYEKVNAYSFNIDMDKKLTQKAGLFYGSEAVYNKINSRANRVNIFTNEESPVNTRYPDGSDWQSYALYANLKVELSPELIANAGVRYSYVALSARFDTTMFPFPFVSAELKNGALNGNAGLVWLPSENVKVYANLSSGFRSPNIDDLGKVFDSQPGSVVVPNADLKPEYAWNAEVGTAFIQSQIFKGEFSVYYTLIDNALARRSYSYNGVDSIMYDGLLSRVEAIQNITNAYVYGIQAGIELTMLKGLKLQSKLSYQYGREQSADSLKYYPLRHAAPLFGTTHLMAEVNHLQADLYANYNAGVDYDQLPYAEAADGAPYAKDENGLPYIPGWYTLNFKATWFINKNLSVNAGVENITNQLYRPFASGITAPGINFIGSLKVSF